MGCGLSTLSRNPLIPVTHQFRELSEIMKKLTLALVGTLLTIGVGACQNPARTSTEAPDSTAAAPESVEKPAAQTNQNDATSELRRRQLNADIRAIEERSQAAGGNKADNDLKSQVRSKLEANLPASALAVDAKDGAITVTGSVVDEAQLQKIEPLAKEISGVTSVTINATISVATPEPPKPGSDEPIKVQTNTP
jgi:hyperosmotically inducible periplasmic protein